jgi:hypothetical protein
MSRSGGQKLTVEEVQAGFEKWRRDRQGRAAIPDELWSAAIELACKDGVNRTAAALHLDGGKLKRRMVEAGAIVQKPVSSAFVELMAPRGGGPAEYTIELEGERSKLRIHCKGATAAELADLGRALWDAAT